MQEFFEKIYFINKKADLILILFSDIIFKKIKNRCKMEIIAHIYTEYKEKFGIPRQSGIVKSTDGKIIFEKEYRNADSLRGLDTFSHIWILWKFSKTEREKWSPTVRPPLLGGNKRVGVFATRSPFRPNPVGLSCVKIEKIEFTKNEGPVIYVSGMDILNGTPIYDIKPYLPYTDSRPDATGGFTEGLSERRVEVIIEDKGFYSLDDNIQKKIKEVLSLDPRPYYKNDDSVYGIKFAELEIKFKVLDGILIIISIEKSEI